MDILAHTMEKKIPFAVQINLTRRCNLRCIHCCVEKRDGERRIGKTPDHELNLEEINRILEQLAEAGCLVLTLSGGEVLLREDLIDIIRYARTLDFAVKVFTNGTLLGTKEIDAFQKLHLQEVHVSLYAANAKIHDGITGVPGSWEKTVKNIRQMREKGISVKIKCPVMRQNIKEYRKVYDLATDLGAGCAFDPVITMRDDGNKDTLNYRIAQEDLQMVLQDPVFYGGEKGERPENISCLITEIYDDVLCSAGHNICYISPEGEVNPCVQLPINSGNLRDHDFNWIWHNSPDMLNIRQMRMKNVHGCKNCDYLSWCARCPGLAYLEDGDLLGHSSAACWLAKAKGNKTLIGG